MHHGLSQTRGRQHPEIGRVQPPPCSCDASTRANIIPTPAHVFSRADLLQHGHPGLVSLAVLLHDYGVSAFRQRRASEDSGRHTGSQAGAGLPRRDALADDQALLAAVQIGAAHGVSIHRTVVPGRYVQGSVNVAGEDASVALLQGQGLCAGEDCMILQQRGQRLIHRRQARTHSSHEARSSACRYS